MSDRFQQLLNSRPFLMADGATGTNLFAAGLMTGDAPEMWNFEHPERIEALHQSFVDAGADLFLTNSFGGTRYRLKLHNAQDKVREINREAARIARRIADKAKQEKGREIIVAGSMGPTGELYEPLGPLSIEDGAEAFAEQVQCLPVHLLGLVMPPLLLQGGSEIVEALHHTGILGVETLASQIQHLASDRLRFGTPSLTQ